MSNLEVKKRNCVYKRVSFDRDWPEQYYNQNNRSRRSYRRSFSDDKGYRSGSFPDGSTPISRRSRLSESDSTVDSSQSKGKRRILRTTRSDAELVNKDFLAQRKRSHWDVLNEKLNEGGIDKSSETKNKWDFLQGKIQFVGVLRHMMSKDLVESRKQRLAKQKQDAAKACLHLFRLAGKMTVYCIRLMNMHSLRNRENDDEVSPFIKGLHFRDYDSPVDLMFDPSKFKANKSMRLSEETKRILSKESQERTPHDIYSTQIAFRNIRSISDYPARMQRKIAEVGVYERYEAKRIIVRQGHPPSAFYFILSGDVVVMKMDESNTYARPVLHLSRGDSFGELGIIQGTKRKATIICREPTELLSISKKDYQNIFMLGGVKSINDPDQDQFLRSLSFLRGWPIDLIQEIQDKTMFHYYKRGDIIAKETHYFDWIIVVKSGSISVMKKLKKVFPFEWKNKVKTEFVSEKQKRDMAEQKDMNRRQALTELNIPTRNAQTDDEYLEEFPGKYKIFKHPINAIEYIDMTNGRYMESVPEVSSNRSSFSLPDIASENKVPKHSRSSFQNIQTLYLPTLSEDTESSVDYAYNTRQNKKEVGTGKLLFSTDTRRKESIIELEKEMIGFQEEKLTYRDDIDTGIKRKDPDHITEADLKPEFVNIQTLTKGQVFGLADLILDPQPNFCVVSNGADCILIDKHFYMEHTTDLLKNRLRNELCPYPSEEEMQSRLQNTVDWEAYRSDIMLQTVNTVKPKRPTKQVIHV